MGSISEITDEEKAYDNINRIGSDAIRSLSDIAIRFDAVTESETNIPDEYAYIEQIHGGYEKNSLAPRRYVVPVEFLCEINVKHDNIHKGRELSKIVQRHFLRCGSACGLTIGNIQAVKAVTTSGHRFAVSIEITYITMV